MRALLARIGTRATTQIYCYQISLQVFSVLLAYPLWPVELTVVAIAVRSYHHRLQHRSSFIMATPQPSRPRRQLKYMRVRCLQQLRAVAQRESMRPQTSELLLSFSQRSACKKSLSCVAVVRRSATWRNGGFTVLLTVQVEVGCHIVERKFTLSVANL
ncbi:hypothetical protein L914_16409 [Phytophthora nicotianae]|uniref:Uncharacterized protein n=1 Tax=Phytophthora nicotianae TaxID=4792 RepID=W2MMX8_PHYNI|nr:hypothetical protein L914_16409 [Phytophthora nicotianae]